MVGGHPMNAVDNRAFVSILPAFNVIEKVAPTDVENHSSVFEPLGSVLIATQPGRELSPFVLSIHLCSLVSLRNQESAKPAGVSLEIS